jgi:hydroxymethylpyrimidine/phosphomethylpyrimidine kinase
MKTALSIAGIDPTGGAGILADCKTFCAYGVYAMGVITSVVAQNTCQAFTRQDISPDLLKSQLTAVFDDIPPDGVKIGMIPTPEAAIIIADTLKKYKPRQVVYDPVMVTSSGTPLMEKETISTIIRQLLPLCTVITPNLAEAETLTSLTVVTRQERENAARSIYAMGARSVLIKGGHLTGDAEDLFFNGKTFTSYSSPRISTQNTHGTGCTLSSALVCGLILEQNPKEAVSNAKSYVTEAIAQAPGLGRGNGPLNHFFTCNLTLYKGE